MKITVEGNAKEIADLVAQIQSQQNKPVGEVIVREPYSSVRKKVFVE